MLTDATTIMACALSEVPSWLLGNLTVDWIMDSESKKSCSPTELKIKFITIIEEYITNYSYKIMPLTLMLQRPKTVWTAQMVAPTPGHLIHQVYTL